MGLEMTAIEVPEEVEKAIFSGHLCSMHMVTIRGLNSYEVFCHKCRKLEERDLKPNE